MGEIICHYADNGAVSHIMSSGCSLNQSHSTLKNLATQNMMMIEQRNLKNPCQVSLKVEKESTWVEVKVRVHESPDNKSKIEKEV